MPADYGGLHVPGNVRECAHRDPPYDQICESVNSEQLLAELDPEQGQDPSPDTLPDVDHRGSVEAQNASFWLQEPSADESLGEWNAPTSKPRWPYQRQSGQAASCSAYTVRLVQPIQTGAVSDRNAPD
jgi:hypothetical protein